MVEKTTLNGKPVKFPMTFSELDENLTEFDNFDFSKLSPKDRTIRITNEKTGYTLILTGGSEDNEEYLDVYNKNGNYLYSVVFYKSEKIFWDFINKRKYFFAR